MRGKSGTSLDCVYTCGSAGTLEQLEQRRLLSTVNVVDFGAVPNDGHDDSGAIKSAINASHGGDVIFFPAGTFDVGATIKLKGDRSYQGISQAAVLRADPNRHIFEIHDDNIRISG